LYSTEEKEADLRDDKVGMDSSIVLKEKVRRFHWSFIFLIPIIMLLLWAIAGILMGMKLIPNLDLGYLWFNKAFFSLF
jgi:energy-converting hydrogenase Eha subunit A